MTNKLDQVCTLLRGLNLTPKRFMIALSEEDDNNAAVSQHYCRTERGWDSTERLILCFKTRATEIVCAQKPQSGMAPGGSYYNLSTLADGFFSKAAQVAWNKELTNSSDKLADLDGSVLKRSRNPAVRRTNWVQTMAQTVCSMLAFGGNHHHNRMQLRNALMFLSGSVTERVSSYLNYIGLCSSRWTAHATLKALSKEAEEKLKA
ncbi:hypothetical protein PSTG_09987 [Puccinia striiformis f. sp. tritici PST-78]|uniref:Uncharacterized protein n=1 Tax=Puccinia striiformis f. sp. tritici PST-78 TaxID=1165861 RepID=A0A0L0VBX9_9BASI|nr:hypothetical protein PSTG_09987 [Puccinia striiformis f. sp. tritici PST-78]